MKPKQSLLGQVTMVHHQRNFSFEKLRLLGSIIHPAIFDSRNISCQKQVRSPALLTYKP